MFLSGVIWTKSFELFAHQRGRKKKTSLLVLLGAAKGGFFVFVLCFFFKYISPPVFFFYCANTLFVTQTSRHADSQTMQRVKVWREQTAKKERVVKNLQLKQVTSGMFG